MKTLTNQQARELLKAIDVILNNIDMNIAVKKIRLLCSVEKLKEIKRILSKQFR